MRKAIVLIVMFMAVMAHAQRPQCTSSNLNASYIDSVNNVQYLCTTAGWKPNVGIGAPAVACSAVNLGSTYLDISTGAVYTCNNGTWAQTGGGAASSVSTTNPGPISNVIAPLTVTSTQGNALPSFQQLEYESLFQGSVPDVISWMGWSPLGSPNPTSTQGAIGTSIEYNYCPIGQSYCQSEYHIVSTPPTTASRNSSVRWLTGYQRLDTGAVGLGIYGDTIGFGNPNDVTQQQLWQLQNGVFVSNNSTDNAAVPVIQTNRNSGAPSSATLKFEKAADSWDLEPNIQTYGNAAFGAAVYSGAKLYIYNGSSSVVPIWITSATLASGNYVHLEDGNGNLFNIGLNGQIANRRGGPIASAATITPPAPFFHVTGTAAITTINPPNACTAGGTMCQITMIPDGAFTTTNTGNIASASTAVVTKALIMTYDSATSTWYPSY